MAHSGIYAIRLKATGEAYIGSSINVHVRWWQHRKRLAAGTHHTKALQAAWNKHGADAFEFELLEFIPEHERARFAEREQHFIDTTPATFNFLKKAYVVPYASQVGHEVSEKTKAKISAAQRGVPKPSSRRPRPDVAAVQTGKTVSEETRAKISAAQKGVPCPARSAAQKGKPRPWQVGRKRSAETRAKMAAAARGNRNGAGPRAPRSAEWCEKLRQPRSPEARERMRQAQLALSAAKRAGS